MPVSEVQTLEIDIPDEKAPEKVTIIGVDLSGPEAVVTFECPGLDEGGEALTGLENAYWGVSNDAASVQAALDRDYATLLSLCQTTGTIDLSPSDADQNKAFSFPKGAPGRRYVHVWTDDVPTAEPT